MSELNEILSNEELATADKIDRLKQLRLEARDRQRAETEGGMAAPAHIDESEQLDLKAIDTALAELGVDVASIEDGGGATL